MTFVTFVQSNDSLKEKINILAKVRIFAKIYFFYIDKDSTFGTTGNTLAFLPSNYSVKAKDIANVKYRINHLPEEYKDWKCDLEKRLENLTNYPEIERTNIDSMVKSPIK